jgi:transposase-like protein
MGTAYWHLEHQYPGVWWCTEHSELLVESEIKSNGVERFQWVLPNLHNKKVPVVERENLFELARLSKFISDFVNLLPLNFMDFSNVHLLYQNAFTDQGYIVGKRLQTIDAVASFQSYIRRFRGITELSSMMKSDEEIKSLLQTILREPRTRTHPVKHMLIMNWLFDCADQVQCQYVKLVDSNKEGFVFNSNQETQVFYKKNQDKRTRFQALVARINSKSLSIRAAAKEIGIDTSTAMVWATQAGIQVTRRPKILTEDIRSKIVQKLRDGTSKEDIAETYVISIVTVTQILRTEIGLHQQWRESCLNIRREEARMEWTNLLKSNAALGSKFLRSLSPSTYAWLYRNDREWLVLNAPERISQLPENRKSVNWDERDFVLAQEVERVALEIQLDIGSKKMMLWHLYQKIPELKAKLSNLSRLPLTQRTIDRVLKRKKIESTLDLTF